MKEYSPIVSVILTSYNQSQYLRQCIESILAQTYDDFELIISDDCSDDDSVEIINSFADERIRLNTTEQKTGQANLNIASCLYMARGKYIAIAHSDDVWAETKLEKQLSEFEKKPSLGAVFTFVEIIDAEGNTSEDNGPFQVFNGTQAEWLCRFFHAFNFLCHPSVMIVRAVYQSIITSLSGVLNFWQLGDFRIWIELLKQKPIFLLPEKLVQYRSHHENMSYWHSKRTRRSFYNEAFFIIKDFFTNMPASLFTEGFSWYFIKKGELTEEELLCERAFLLLKGGVPHLKYIYWQIGIEMLHDMLTFPAMRQVLELSYNFTNKTYYELLGNSIAMKCERNEYYYDRLIASEAYKESKAIAIYGCGDCGTEIFSYISLYDYGVYKIKCFIDREKGRIGESLFGLDIVSLEEAVNGRGVETVIIASQQYQDVIYDRILENASINVDIIKVYNLEMMSNENETRNAYERLLS